MAFSKVIVLTGQDNYPMWAFKFEQVLDGLDVWDIVDPEQELADEDLALLFRNTTEFETKRKVAVRAFTAGVTQACIYTVAANKQNPRQLWIQLKQKYESSAFQRRIDLRSDLRSITMAEDETVEEFIKRIDSKLFQLGSIMEFMDEKELMHIVLRALPPPAGTLLRCPLA